MTHLALLGDSIFDNVAYVDGGIDVIHHVRQQMPSGWTATLRAVDGSVAGDVRSQLRNLPAGTTHLIVSAGGNNALGRIDILEAKARSAADVLNLLADISEEFHQQYTGMLRSVLALKIPTAVCTIYYPRFPDAVMQRLAVAALSTFNDVIIREAFRAGIPILDLRLICNDDKDYANPIEPSESGGQNIAATIIRLVQQHDYNSGRTEVFI